MDRDRAIMTRSRGIVLLLACFPVFLLSEQAWAEAGGSPPMSLYLHGGVGAPVDPFSASDIEASPAGGGFSISPFGAPLPGPIWV